MAISRSSVAILMVGLLMTATKEHKVYSAPSWSSPAVIGAGVVGGIAIFVGSTYWFFKYALMPFAKYVRHADMYKDDAQKLYTHLRYDYEEIIGAYDELVKIQLEEQRLLLQRPPSAITPNVVFIPNGGGNSLERLLLDQMNKLKIMARMKLLRSVENALDRHRLPTKITWWEGLGWKFFYETENWNNTSNQCGTLEHYKVRVQEVVEELETMQQELLRKEAFPVLQAVENNPGLAPTVAIGAIPMMSTTPVPTISYAQSAVMLSLSSSWEHDPINVRLRRLSDALVETIRILESMKSTITPEYLSTLPITSSQADIDFFQPASNVR